jgi:hypothetical protein
MTSCQLGVESARKNDKLCWSPVPRTSGGRSGAARSLRRAQGSSHQNTHNGNREYRSEKCNTDFDEAEKVCGQCCMRSGKATCERGLPPRCVAATSCLRIDVRTHCNHLADASKGYGASADSCNAMRTVTDRVGSARVGAARQERSHQATCAHPSSHKHSELKDERRGREAARPTRPAYTT